MNTQRIIAKKEVIHLTGLSKSTIYLYIQKGKFPPPIQIGFRRVGWIESEVGEWLQNKIEQGRLQQDKRLVTNEC